MLEWMIPRAFHRSRPTCFLDKAVVLALTAPQLYASAPIAPPDFGVAADGLGCFCVTR